MIIKIKSSAPDDTDCRLQGVSSASSPPNPVSESDEAKMASSNPRRWQDTTFLVIVSWTRHSANIINPTLNSDWLNFKIIA